MILTNAWDACVVYVRTTHDGIEVKVGLFCLLLAVWLAARFIQWFVQRDSTGGAG